MNSLAILFFGLQFKHFALLDAHGLRAAAIQTLCVFLIFESPLK